MNQARDQRRYGKHCRKRDVHVRIRMFRDDVTFVDAQARVAGVSRSQYIVARACDRSVASRSRRSNPRARAACLLVAIARDIEVLLARSRGTDTLTPSLDALVTAAKLSEFMALLKAFAGEFFADSAADHDYNGRRQEPPHVP